MSDNKPIVFDYFDYKEFLRDFYDYHKQKEPSFSHRAFLKKAGIGGTMYLQRVIQGTQKLGRKYINNFIQAIGFSRKEAAYFTTLVHFINARNRNKRLGYLQEILKIRSEYPKYRINDRKLKFFRKWYYPVIRELATVVDFKEDYSLLGRMVIPRLNAEQARSAVTFLVENDFLKKSEDGRYIQTEPVITTGPQVNSAVLAEYHRTTLIQSADSVHEIHRDKRDISSITLGVSEETFEKIRDEIVSFRQRLLAIAREEKSAEKVCMVGFQLIPRSKSIRGGLIEEDD